MDILQKIVAHKKQEVESNQRKVSIQQLEEFAHFKRKTISLSDAIRNSKTGIIAEFKRKSPSKGEISINQTVETVTKGYEEAGVSALSILTDSKFFGGSSQDLAEARNTVNLPILRKEFIISEYQIIEAKAIGADAILLIARILSKEEIRRFSTLAQSIGLEVLIEIHEEEELSKSVLSTINLIGVNNRNLNTFEVDITNSIALSQKIPNEFVKIAESGLNNVDSITHLQQYGFQGFLIGEYFMKSGNAGQTAEELIAQIQSYEA